MPAASRSSAAGGGDWRAALDGYLPRPEGAASDDFTALALQFELRELIPRTRELVAQRAASIRKAA